MLYQKKYCSGWLSQDAGIFTSALNRAHRKTSILSVKGLRLTNPAMLFVAPKKAGMEIRGSFIFAMPGDTPEKAEETIRFACEINVDWLVFYPYQVQPGTYLGDIAPEYGTVLVQDVDSLIPSYIPKAYESKSKFKI